MPGATGVIGLQEIAEGKLTTMLNWAVPSKVETASCDPAGS
jgi:hypothetical protein